MVGAKQGFYGLLSKEIPFVITVHCMAHRLELSLKDCLKKGISEKVVSGLLLSLFYFYHKSPRNRSLLKLSFKSLALKPRIPTRVGGTRWVSHLYNALEVWKASYPAICQQLEQLQQGDTKRSTGAAKAKKLLSSMKDKNIVHFCHLLLDVTFHLRMLSLICQRQTAIVSEVKSEIDATVTILKQFKTS